MQCASYSTSDQSDRKNQTDVKCHVNHPLSPPHPPSSQRLVRAERSIPKCWIFFSENHKHLLIRTFLSLVFPYVGNNLSPTPWKHLPFKSCPPTSLSSSQTAHLCITIWFCNNPVLSMRTGGRPPRPAPKPRLLEKSPDGYFTADGLLAYA